jgi:hypothetical protein
MARQNIKYGDTEDERKRLCVNTAKGSRYNGRKWRTQYIAVLFLSLTEEAGEVITTNGPCSLSLPLCFALVVLRCGRKGQLMEEKACSDDG